MRIVFFGTPEFAAYSLRSLVQHHREVVGVVTMPDKPKGRGHKRQPSDVKEVALKELPDVPVLQPERLRDPDFLEELRRLKADLFIVVAFRMLPEVVWDMPPMGTINLHAALLPNYRGAAPIQRVLMRGETMTGVTTFFLDKEIDTGRIILQEEVPVAPDETGGTLHDKLMVTGAELIERTIDLIEATDDVRSLGTAQPESAEGLLGAPKIFKVDRMVNFQSMTATEIDRIVRAMAPYPKAIATFVDCEGEETEIKLSAVKVVYDHTLEEAEPGSYQVTADRRFTIRAKEGMIEILELQWPSSKSMRTDAFLLGHTPFPEGSFV